LIGFYPILNAITLSGFSESILERRQFFLLFETHSPERALSFRIG
jgi:hypothetical protein